MYLNHSQRLIVTYYYQKLLKSNNCVSVIIIPHFFILAVCTAGCRHFYCIISLFLKSYHHWRCSIHLFYSILPNNAHLQATPNALLLLLNGTLALRIFTIHYRRLAHYFLLSHLLHFWIYSTELIDIRGILRFPSVWMQVSYLRIGNTTRHFLNPIVQVHQKV